MSRIDWDRIQFAAVVLIAVIATIAVVTLWWTP